MRCQWKVGIPLESKPGNQFSSQDDLGYMELSSSCCGELGVPQDLGQSSVFLGNLWSCLKEVKPPVVFDGEHRMALEPMQGNRASS